MVLMNFPPNLTGQWCPHLDLAVRDSALGYPYRLFDGLLRKIRLSLHVGLSVADNDLIISADKKTKRYKWIYPK
jgi:hypothetical protein